MCVLGFVGFGPRLPRHLQGLLGRCDWTPVCFNTLADLMAYTVQPDVLICNASAIDTCGCVDDDALSTMHAKSEVTGTPLPFIFVGSQRFDVPSALQAHPVHVLHRPGTYYERFGHLIHEVLRQSDECCDS